MHQKERDFIQSEKTYRIWRKFMTWGEHTGCHQMPERSFFYKGYQMPVCARCTGVITGYLAAVPCFLLSGFHWMISAAGCLCMLADWLLQALKIIPSTNKRRFLSGIAGGFGLMSFQIYIIKKILSHF